MYLHTNNTRKKISKKKIIYLYTDRRCRIKSTWNSNEAKLKINQCHEEIIPIKINKNFF